MINNCCNHPEEHSNDARMHGYRVLYEAQEEAKANNKKLHWSEEREIFLLAAHEYDIENGGKIDLGDQD